MSILYDLTLIAFRDHLKVLISDVSNNLIASGCKSKLQHGRNLIEISAAVLKMTTNSVQTANLNENTEHTSDKTAKKGLGRREKIIGGLFLGSLTSFSLLAGFGVTLSSSRKQDPESFAKGLISFSNKGITESGGTLALRALGKATLYTCGTFGLVTFIVAKAMGVSSIHEFYVKLDSLVPKFKKKEPTGRQEFDSIRELFEYIIDEDEKAKNDKTK